MSFGPGCVKLVDLAEFEPEPKPNHPQANGRRKNKKVKNPNDLLNSEVEERERRWRRRGSGYRRRWWIYVKG